MIPRHQAFLADSAEVSGTVTRFAIVDCKLDPTLKVAVLKLVLDWVLSERAEGQALGAVARPWRATFYKRDKAGHSATVAVVEVTAADAVVEERGAEGRQFRFHVEVEFELPVDVPFPPLETTIRRVEAVFRSPSGDMMGYTDSPDVDPDHGEFPPDMRRWIEIGRTVVLGSAGVGLNPELASWLDHGSNPLGGDSVDDTFSLRTGPSAPDALMKPTRNARVSLPAARREATTVIADAPKALEAPQIEPVDAAVFCPPTVSRAMPFLVQVFLYLPAETEVARAQAHEADTAAERRGVLSLPLDLPRGTRIDLHLEMPGLPIDEPDAVLVWRGTLAAAQFEVTVPSDASLGTAIGRIRFSIAGVPAGTLRFLVTVVAENTHEAARAAEMSVQRYRRAFVSYSSKDRAEVLRRVQAFRIAGLSVFQDVLDLEPGDRWDRELYREIDNCDVFLLFWSRAAAASP
ncbi:MAG: toll/interleukin-1 receptor domain-containing protein, partial [Burkholderiaceae bacterium]